MSGEYLSLFLNWLTRGLTIVGGVIAVLLGWPITQAAWQAQRADSTLYGLRTGTEVSAGEAAVSLEMLNRAVALDPVASRYLVRSELLGSAALTPGLLKQEQRTDWLRRARADLLVGLANAPARGIGWLRLGAVEQELYGPSRRIVRLLLTSIQLSPGIPQTWPVQLRLILDCWTYLTDGEKDRVKQHVQMIWRQSQWDRRLFAHATRSAADHAILTLFVRDIPGAAQELATVIEKEHAFQDAERKRREQKK